jgi:hypothetical protein
MQVECTWHRAIELQPSATNKSRFTCPARREVPEDPGVYVFVSRKRKRTLAYIGQAIAVAGRLNSYLRQENRALSEFRKFGGSLCILACTIPFAKRASKTPIILDVLESALIGFALGAKWELINVQQRKSGHTLDFVHTAESRALFPDRIKVPKRS